VRAVFNSPYKGDSKVVVIGVYELRPTTACALCLCKGHSKVLAIKQQQQQQQQQSPACGRDVGEDRGGEGCCLPHLCQHRQEAMQQ
jgi:hypothetical protein